MSEKCDPVNGKKRSALTPARDRGRLPAMWLAGDVGGTKIMLGLYERAARRPREVVVETIRTGDAPHLSAVIEEFLHRHLPATRRIEGATLGVAGPVIDGRAQLTNVPWHVDASRISASTGIARVALLNDLEALAHAVEVLDESELDVLQAGQPTPRGNAVIIAAGTGLGEAVLVDRDGRLVPSPSEGGHADFAARTGREAGLMAALTKWFGRAEWESVLSGPGLVNLHRFTHDDASCAATEGITEKRLLPARITEAGLAGSCPGCAEALDLFVRAYGAEAGNMAMRSVATRGVFVAGGIAPKILPALRDGRFMDAFLAKQPMHGLVARIPVKVILNPRAALVGCAVHAAGGS
jgi:glucokinase